jgi:hypothetical protein
LVDVASTLDLGFSLVFASTITEQVQTKKKHNSSSINVVRTLTTEIF